MLIRRYHGKQHVQSNFHQPLLFFFPKAEKGFHSAVSKGQNHLVQADRVGQVDEGGSLRGCNYRLLSSVKKGPEGLITAQKTKRHSYPGSHSRAGRLGLFARYAGHKET